jgi:hypothetical protein
MGTQIHRRLVTVAALALLALSASVAATAGVEPGQDERDPVSTTAETPPSADPAPAPIAEPPAPPPPVEAEDGSGPTAGAGPLVRAAATVYAAVSAGSDTALTSPRAEAPRPAPEVSLPRRATSPGILWIWGALPDPTPPSRRLDAAFARQLRLTARRERVDWALVLAVLRARGRLGAVPAGPLGLNGATALVARAAARARVVAARRPPGFTGGWTAADRAILAAQARREAFRAALERISRDAEFTDRAVALALYYRAVGLGALHRGLEATKASLARRLLRDPRINIYPGGRADIEADRIDIRVLTVIAYLTATYGQVTASSLDTGHALFARPGAVSAHALGRAVDVTALAGIPIEGHQQADGITADAVQAVLRLPAELQARQVISLLGFGGPSFPLANHHDHIHVGF